MAKSPLPGGVRRGVVEPPNKSGPGGNRANNGYLPLGGSASPVSSAGLGGGDRRDGSVPLGGMASPVHPPDHRFNVPHRRDAATPLGDRTREGCDPGEPVERRGSAEPAVSQPDAERPPRR